MKRVLVTGGAGFVGSFLVDRLVRDGMDVVSIDTLETQVHLGKKPDYLNPKCEYLWTSCADRAALRKVLADTEVIFHLAAIVGVGQSMYEIARYVEGNTMSTAVLLEEVLPFKKNIRKMLVASSMSIYGEGAYRASDGSVFSPSGRTELQLEQKTWDIMDPATGKALESIPTSETKTLYPSSIYAIGKRDQEEMVLTVGKCYGIPALALRFFNIYGSRQALSNPYTGVAAIFSSRFLAGEQPLIFEDGNQKRDFVHVSDIVDGLCLAMRSDADQETFNLGSGQFVTIKRVAEILSQEITKGRIQAHVSGQFRAGDIRHCYADISKAAGRLGYKPKYSFEKGVAELVAWVRTQTRSADSFSQALKTARNQGIIR